ncbi:MAG TPA: alkaline phosphatase family protein [Acidimicrobiia bacterium]|nr:alkaline phosphatase family protein [Acidimicrobiia bacterium]
MPERRLSRRAFIGRTAALGGALAVSRLGWSGAWSSAARPPPLRQPGSLPHPRLPVGTDTLPKIDHIIVAMMENHSYDNYLGMLRRGDGFRLDGRGRPTATNPDDSGNLVRAFRMPSACQLEREPGQNWNASHVQYDNGRNDGFVRASGPVAMGYWTKEDVPFYYALASTFPVCDRWFGSCLGQTYPNRRFLLAGTAHGLVSTDVSKILAPSPPNGLILDQLDAHGISWRNYYTDLPATGLYKSPVDNNRGNLVGIDQFYADAAAGSLPGFSLVDPGFDNDESEENDADIQLGESFMSRVVNAVMHGPAWSKSLLVWLYDEHGGYYDHVPPPAAVKPDDIPPDIHVPPDQPGGYDRYGFRVPAVIVSPYARRNYVSHVVHDHTSILKLVETKWNLPALTFRDANADNLLDSLDFSRPAFRHPPKLAEPGRTSNPSVCTPGEPGVIPPPGAVRPAPSTTTTTRP